MNFKVFEAKHNRLMFKIEEDYPEVGVYLYVYEDEKCIKDFLQDDINTCKNLAYEDFGVPVCNWNEIIEEEE